MCKEDDHALTENFPHAEYWEYCCDCGRFCLSNLNKHGVKAESQCLGCARKIKHWYICGTCKVITIETYEATKDKMYSLENGLRPQPACPGCLSTPDWPLREHKCEKISFDDHNVPDDQRVIVRFTTTLAHCPFCGEETFNRPQLSLAGNKPRGKESALIAPEVMVPPPKAHPERATLFENFLPKSNKSRMELISLAIGVLGVLITIIAFLFPFVPSYIVWRLKKPFNGKPVLARIECHQPEVLEGEAVLLSAISEDDDVSTLQYVWKTTLGRIEGVGREVKLNTTGIKPQMVPIEVEVSVNAIDSYGETASEKRRVYVTTLGLSNKPPHIEGIKPTPSEVPAGESVSLDASTEDPNNDKLTYHWHTSAGQILGDGRQVTLNTIGVNPQSNTPITATITLKVDDGRGGAASNDIKVNIYQKQTAKSAPSVLPTPPPVNKSPRLSMLMLDKNPVKAGDDVTVEADATDEDNDKLVYDWEVPKLGFRVMTNNPSFTFKTSDIKPPLAGVLVLITLKVSDARGGSTSLSTKVTVLPPAVLPTPEQTPRPTPTTASSSSPSFR
jgi:hypothetical protein